ncbi:hypothetical protein F4804DRAFT_271582 [Jackrogersella minutella]|nr:hypothetical protein F4804DRAFT_271582 [Jackrogersella minutella]
MGGRPIQQCPSFRLETFRLSYPFFSSLPSTYLNSIPSVLVHRRVPFATLSSLPVNLFLSLSFLFVFSFSFWGKYFRYGRIYKSTIIHSSLVLFRSNFRILQFKPHLGILSIPYHSNTQIHRPADTSILSERVAHIVRRFQRNATRIFKRHPQYFIRCGSIEKGRKRRVSIH